MSSRGPIKGYPRAAVAVILAIVTGVGVLDLLCPAGVSLERVRAATPAASAADSDEAPSMPAPAVKRQVVIDSNDQCYVCHMPLVEESLAAVHAKVHVWCGTCHGPSTPHIEDENIGATPPDIVHNRDEVDRMCGQCHDPEEHSILTGKTRRARLAGGRKAQEEIKGRKVEATGVCTDCHGRHWIPPRGQQTAPQGSGADPGAGSTAVGRSEADGGARSNGAGGISLGCCSNAAGPVYDRSRRRFRALNLISTLTNSRTSRRACAGRKRGHCVGKSQHDSRSGTSE